MTATPGLAGVPGLARLVVDVPDFPQPGVTFKDLTPLLASRQGLAVAVAGLVGLAPEGVDVVVAPEARGFIFGVPVALGLGVGFVPVRKPHKLPRARLETSYDLEYGTETIAVHADALVPGARVLLVDDVLATGGTLAAAADLVARLDAEVVAAVVVLELPALDGRARLHATGLADVRTLLTDGG